MAKFQYHLAGVAILIPAVALVRWAAESRDQYINLILIGTGALLVSACLLSATASLVATVRRSRKKDLACYRADR